MNGANLVAVVVGRVRQALYFAALIVAVGSLWTVAWANGQDAKWDSVVDRTPNGVATSDPASAADPLAAGHQPWPARPAGPSVSR